MKNKNIRKIYFLLYKNFKFKTFILILLSLFIMNSYLLFSAKNIIIDTIIICVEILLALFYFMFANSLINHIQIRTNNNRMSIQ